MDVPSRSGRSRTSALRRLHASSLAIALALILGLLPLAAAEAVDIYHARAIGQEYLPEPPPATTPAPPGAREAPELPGLGASAEPEQAAPPSLWKKVLIGTLVVAAIAALGNGGGSGGVSVGTGDGGSTPDAGGGDNGGGGNAGDRSGISIDAGLGSGNGGGERGRHRGRGRDDDARGRSRGRDSDED